MRTAQIVDASNRGGPNPQLKNKIRVVKGKIEDYSGPKVDTLISEPIGLSPWTLLPDPLLPR